MYSSSGDLKEVVSRISILNLESYTFNPFYDRVWDAVEKFTVQRWLSKEEKKEILEAAV